MDFLSSLRNRQLCAITVMRPELEPAECVNSRKATILPDDFDDYAFQVAPFILTQQDYMYF